MEKQIYIRLLVLIIVLGLALRLYNLDTESLWIDESFSVQHAAKGTVFNVIDGVKETEAAPPGYYVFLHSWIQWFGDSADSVRFPSVIFGTLAILVLFLLVSKLYGFGTALLASLFLSTSMLQVLYSQEARIYSLFTLLTLFTVYFFIEIIQREKAGKKCLMWYWLYGISLLASIYTNYLGILFWFMGAVLFPLFIFWKRKDLILLKKVIWNWCALHLAVLVLSLPLFPIAKSQYALLHFGLAEILVARGLPSWLAHMGLWFFILPLLAIFSFLLLLFFIDRRRKEAAPERKRLKEIFFLALLALSGLFYVYLVINPLQLFGVTLLPTPLTNSYFLIRHSFFLAPLLYIYLARKIIALPSRRVLLFVILVILIINSFSLSWYYAQPTKAEWKEAVHFISSSESGNAALVLLDSGGMANTFLLDYYSDGKFRIIPLTWADRAKVGRKLEQLSSAQVLEIVQGKKEVWLVLSRNQETEDKYKEILDTFFTNDLYKEFYQIKSYRYKAMDSDTMDTAPAPKVDLYKRGFMNVWGAYG